MDFLEIIFLLIYTILSCFLQLFKLQINTIYGNLSGRSAAPMRREVLLSFTPISTVNVRIIHKTTLVVTLMNCSSF